MQAGLRAGAAARRSGWFGSALVVAWTILVLARSGPLAAAYLLKLSAGHPAPALAVAVSAAVVLLAGLTVLFWKRPSMAAAALAVFAAATAVLSGNAGALAIAVLLLAATLWTGDLLLRALLGRDPDAGELTAAFATGLVAVGLLVLVLGEAGALSPGTLAAALCASAIARPRRLSVLARRFAVGIRLPRGDAPRPVEAAWLAFAALVVAALWVGALCPDVSWDGLAYHLPEARDIASAGRIAASPDLEPQSLLWRNHDAYLATAFLFGGEGVARFLQFAAGLAVFGASLTLARRLGAGGAGPLVVLTLAAFPTAMLQLHATYVDWPAALLVAASASELAVARGDPGRLRTGAFLFAGAVVVKIFALLAAPALAILVLRSRPRARSIAAAFAVALLAAGPWLAWSTRHAGSLVAPYASSPSELLGRIGSGHYFTTSPASGAVAAAPSPSERLVRFLRLPYDLTFHSSRFEANGDGYGGVLALAALAGLAGWDARRLFLFVLAAAPVLFLWSRLYLPSVRYLFPLYPLYAVFAAEGLRRLTSRFAGAAGVTAGAALLAAAAAFPVQFGSSGLEWRAAAGRITRGQYLEAKLPSYTLRGRLAAGDRVVLFGENDRFHCPAAAAWRDDYLPVAAWGRDPAAWRRGLDALGITAVLDREDRRRGATLLGALGDRLEIEARNGPAVLYRVRPGPDRGSPGVQ